MDLGELDDEYGNDDRCGVLVQSGYVLDTSRYTRGLIYQNYTKLLGEKGNMTNKQTTLPVPKVG